MANDPFFEEQKLQSEAKTRIVAKYFWAWARVMAGNHERARTPNPRIAYVDLFAGPGRYGDGVLSTPLHILNDAINEPKLGKMLVTLFNDAHPEHSASLTQAIKELPGIETLKYQPQVSNVVIGEEVQKFFQKANLVPTFSFIDPFGYKGLSLGLIQSVVKDFGCDSLFFFNYNRINMGIRNDLVEQHMNGLFGQARADALRARLEGLSPDERELRIVDELTKALKELGPKYVMPFRFVDEKRNRTSHYLIFVTKHFLGYEIMKGIMHTESSKHIEGVGSFCFNPADIKYPTLFEYAKPLSDLEDELLKRYAGRTMALKQVYMDHNVDTPFVEKHYREVLCKLEADGRIVGRPAVGQLIPGKTTKRRANTMAEYVTVQFPAYSGYEASKGAGH